MNRGQVQRGLGQALAVTALLAIPSLAFAKDKTEKASSAAKRTAKSFFKLKNYTVDVQATGGVSDNKKHVITQTAVSKSYSAKSYKKIMEVSSPLAYRRGKSGAVMDSKANRFKSLEALEEGKEMSRLFRTPEDVMAEISKSASKAKWLQKPINATSSKNKKKKRPTTGQDGTSTETDSLETRNGILRITVAGSRSLKRFIEVQNSGCLGGG
ncbi:MAG: hypothetical protein P1V97_04110 [Planctomycetota bacterium]|nr:hypothetical protein [Planctomycetota bacterium]